MRIIPCCARFFPVYNNVPKWSNKSNSDNDKGLKSFVDNRKSRKKHKYKK